MRCTVSWLIILLYCPACSQTPSGDQLFLNERCAVSLIPISHRDWIQRLKDFRGSIVVVDFWATWCGPCLERFPHMVELHETFGERGVEFISMCLDDRSDYEAVGAARKFLQETNATFHNYLMDENILDAFEKLDLLGIPAVFIYDREGVLKYRLTSDDPRSQFTDTDVQIAIEELVRTLER